MKVRFRQTSMGWCTVFMWANLLNSKDLMTKFWGDERFKGCNKEEEDEILQAFMPEVSSHDLIFVDPGYPLLPKSYIWTLIQREDPILPFTNTVIPYILTVNLIKGIWHSVAIVKYGADFYYLDPYKENWLKIEWYKQFENLFLECCSVARPISRSDRSYQSFNADAFEYPFLQPEHDYSS